MYPSHKQRHAFITESLTQKCQYYTILCPHSWQTRDRISTFLYEGIEELLEDTEIEENVIVGDFNAKVDKGRVEDIVGNSGLGERNTRKTPWCIFVKERN